LGEFEDSIEASSQYPIGWKMYIIVDPCMHFKGPMHAFFENSENKHANCILSTYKWIYDIILKGLL